MTPGPASKERSVPMLSATGRNTVPASAPIPVASGIASAQPQSTDPKVGPVAITGRRAACMLCTPSRISTTKPAPAEMNVAQKAKAESKPWPAEARGATVPTASTVIFAAASADSSPVTAIQIAKTGAARTSVMPQRRRPTRRGSRAGADCCIQEAYRGRSSGWRRGPKAPGLWRWSLLERSHESCSGECSGCIPAGDTDGLFESSARSTPGSLGCDGIQRRQRAAIVAGDLTRNAGGCFGLSMPYGQPGESEFYTTQFPKGTEVLEDESGVALPNGDIVMLGEFINGGGGYLSESSLDELENFPASCPSAEVAVLEAL
ncbi:hypothetical protein ACFPRL_07600 [Pseudoclavibacter helvolus]